MASSSCHCRIKSSVFDCYPWCGFTCFQSPTPIPHPGSRSWSFLNILCFLPPWTPPFMVYQFTCIPIACVCVSVWAPPSMQTGSSFFKASLYIYYLTCEAWLYLYLVVMFPLKVRMKISFKKGLFYIYYFFLKKCHGKFLKAAHISHPYLYYILIYIMSVCLPTFI